MHYISLFELITQNMFLINASVILKLYKNINWFKLEIPIIYQKLE